ncbi:MAG: hypothetical protein PHW10_06155 [Candidatus Peribacteraceae bacterium]|nr:hypothetical protein [Candidatus Peribacteraceae bacterium]
MAFDEHSDAFGLWLETYESAQEAMGKMQGMMAELCALQIMFLAEMLGLTFCSATAARAVLAEIRRNIADILDGKEVARQRPDGMKADGDERC